MQFVGLSDIGLCRQRNEDAWYVDTERGLFVICDGMGGHSGGNVASALAVEVVRDKLVLPELPEQIADELENAVRLANNRIWSAAQLDETLLEMGTTITTAVIVQDTAYIAHVGDSSLYLVRGKDIIKLTQDHTMADEMRRDGLMRGEEDRYRHILTRALGIDPVVEIDSFNYKLVPQDILLFCTDGLGGVLSAKEIYQHIRDSKNLEGAAQALLEAALAQDGSDNVTIVLVMI